MASAKYTGGRNHWLQLLAITVENRKVAATAGSRNIDSRNADHFYTREADRKQQEDVVHASTADDNTTYYNAGQDLQYGPQLQASPSFHQSGTLPIWVTLSRLPKQVTLNMNFSQQLPK